MTAEVTAAERDTIALVARRAGLTLNERQFELLCAAAPYVAGQAMMTRDDTVRGVVVRGVLPEEEPKVSDVAGQIKQGNFNDLRAGEFNIVLGLELARGAGAPGRSAAL